MNGQVWNVIFVCVFLWTYIYKICRKKIFWQYLPLKYVNIVCYITGIANRHGTYQVIQISHNISTYQAIHIRVFLLSSSEMLIYTMPICFASLQTYFAATRYRDIQSCKKKAWKKILKRWKLEARGQVVSKEAF